MLTNGQFDPHGDLAATKESVALPNNSQVATFSDSNLADTTSSFTVTIDWGDGQTTPGTVVGSNGHFTVESGHTYADENQYPALVTVTNTVDSSQLSIAGTVPVADTDSFNVQPKTISYTPNTPLTDVTVATFTDLNTSNVQGDFTATIDWGDMTPSTTGTVQGSNGSFSIVGSHTYTAAGEFTVSVSFADDAADAATGFAMSTAVSGFGGQVTVNSASEGTPVSGQIATFADTSGSHAATDYTATIDWGDGSSGVPGTVSGSGQSFTVTGSHTYADEESDEIGGGSPVLSVTITRSSDSVTTMASGIVTVADADFLTGSSKTIGASPNQVLPNVTVVTFTDPYLGQVASELPATINWGDGSDIDTGTVSGSSGSFTVKGSHTYTANGDYKISIGIFDDVTQPTQIGSFVSTAIIGLAPHQFQLLTIKEGDATSHDVATFDDGNSGDTLSDFQALIDWGDGFTTFGTIAGGAGSFTVSGSHPFGYADEGIDPVVVTLTRTADQETATVTGDVTVGEADGFVVTADNFNGNPGIALNNQVATFTDTFAGQVGADLAATISWGDGTSSAGTVSGGSGSFTVNASHTYATGGNYTFNVSVADDAPGTASASANGMATINFAGHMVLTSATEGTAIPNGPVATFSDSNGGDTPASFTATINWGDGVTSPGTLSGGAGTFTVSGAHTYADEGSDTAQVILTHTADQATSTVSGSVAVAEADALTAHGTSFTANAHQVFTGTVATFDDTGYPANVPGDFTASIDWGDGQTTGGIVSGGNGSAFTVNGSHVYAAAGQDTVKVKLTDDAPGTATNTATSTATVNQGASIPYDFNADAISDLVFQNEGFNAGSAAGTPQIWLWNGTAVTSQMTYPNPSADWHIITSRDVNGDGNADLIWQSTAGQPGIWLMNGTTPISEVGLTNPGSAWHLVASGDTNHDGDSDLIWQNADGTLGLWLMNGTTPTAEVGLTNPGSNWKVVGAADYSGDGNDDILLQDTNTGNLKIDLMNGTSISSTVSITVGDPSWHAVSTGEFNGQAEIAWQNNNGTLGIWLMNGTTPAAEVGLSNPGAGWQLISIDHFTPNGQADLLLQNTNGAMMLWEMNGTSVVTQLNLPNPGSGQQSENGHPFTVAVINAGTTTGFSTANSADPGSGSSHLSAPDTGAAIGQSSPFNPLHMTFAGG